MEAQCRHLFILFFSVLTLPFSFKILPYQYSVRTCRNFYIFFRCACGLLRTQHEGELTENVGEWASSTHTREVPTNAFGCVSFSQEQQDAILGAEV